MLENNGFDNIKKLTLDGELYYHGKHLNEISAYVRADNQSIDKSLIEYHIFDIYYEKEEDVNNVIYIERLRLFEKIKELYSSLNNSFGKIVFLDTNQIGNSDDAVNFYKNSLELGYEGSMIRIPSGKYDMGYDDYHSKQLIKIKPLLRDEFLCVGYTSGKGKSSDLIILKCELTSKNVKNAIHYMSKRNIMIDIYTYKDYTGTSFNVTPKATEEERRKMLIDFNENFKSKYENRLYTCEFRDYSKKKLTPERGVGIGFRFDI